MKKRNIITTLALACLFCFTVINTTWADCDPTDSDCTSINDVSGMTNTNFTHTFGDDTNGGWSTITGGMCGTSQGNNSATFDGYLDGTAGGALSEDGETASSKAELIFNGHGTNGETGLSDIIADGEASEASFMADNSQSNWYVSTGQKASGASSAEDSTTGRELNFAAKVSAEGSSGYTFTSTENSRSLNMMANNVASASFSGDGTAETSAMNEIAGGAMLNGTVAEIYGNANMTCPEGGTAWTNGTGNINITQTPTTNGFKIRADVSVSEASGQ